MSLRITTLRIDFGLIWATQKTPRLFNSSGRSSFILIQMTSADSGSLESTNKEKSMQGGGNSDVIFAR